MKKHRITVKLSWAALNKDVRDRASRFIRLAKLSLLTKLSTDDDTLADRLESELTLTDDDMPLLRRAMTEGMSEVITLCSDYVRGRSHTSDNYSIGADEITLTLMMPLNFNLAGCESLGNAIHAYMVSKAMLEWLRCADPSRFLSTSAKGTVVSEQQEACALALQEIATIINARVRAIRSGECLLVVTGDGNSCCEAVSEDSIDGLLDGTEEATTEEATTAEATTATDSDSTCDCDCCNCCNSGENEECCDCEAVSDENIDALLDDSDATTTTVTATTEAESDSDCDCDCCTTEEDECGCEAVSTERIDGLLESD